MQLNESDFLMFEQNNSLGNTSVYLYTNWFIRYVYFSEGYT